MEHHPNDNPEPIELETKEPEHEALASDSASLESASETACSATLFETYEPRSAATIISQQQAMQESEAAEAAGIILQDIEPLEFDSAAESFQSQLLSQSYGAMRVGKTTPLGYLFSPGAQFVYALIIISLLGGLIGLAATIESPTLVLIAGIASPLLLPICAWKWIRWLDSTPYYYRLLTSLGEDARNLLGHRLFWKQSSVPVK